MLIAERVSGFVWRVVVVVGGWKHHIFLMQENGNDQLPLVLQFRWQILKSVRLTR